MLTMKRLILIPLSLAFILLLGACGMNLNNMNPFQMMKSSDDRPGNPMMMMHGKGNTQMVDSTGENELNIPPVLESDKETGNNISYAIEAKKGQTEIFEGIQTETLGYNSSFLGPVVKLKKGQTAHLKLKNSLDEETTFHWHGLIIGGEADGGLIQPGEEKEITFKVQQEASTLWCHPHPLGKTAKQVYEGLAGLIYIEDDMENPYVYGENDFPLIIQD